MKIKEIIFLMGIGSVMLVGAMDQGYTQLQGKAGERIDENNRLVRIDQRGKAIHDDETGKDFLVYRFNNYALPALAVGAGTLGMATAITMNPGVATANMVTSVLVLGSSAIKVAELIERKCKRPSYIESDEDEV